MAELPSAQGGVRSKTSGKSSWAGGSFETSSQEELVEGIAEMKTGEAQWVADCRNCRDATNITSRFNPYFLLCRLNSGCVYKYRESTREAVDNVKLLQNASAQTHSATFSNLFITFSLTPCLFFICLLQLSFLEKPFPCGDIL